MKKVEGFFMDFLTRVRWMMERDAWSRREMGVDAEEPKSRRVGGKSEGEEIEREKSERERE